MAVTLTDVRCPQCGRKLAEAASVASFELRIKCPRCKRVMVIKAA